MNALDTNIWIYSHDCRDVRKQQIAQQLIDSVQPLALPWQVGCEFVVASRKLAAQGFDETKVWLALEKMQIMADAILVPTPALWAETRSLQQLYTLSFWDALLVGICIRDKVQTLYTEDMGAPRMIDGLSLVDPFLVSP